MKATLAFVPLIALVLISSGCKQKGEVDVPAVKSEDVVGEWVEIYDPRGPGAGSGRVMPIARPTKQHRIFKLNPDNTFVMYLGDESGKGDESKAFTGTWKIDGFKVMLEAGNNTLGENFAPWAPQRIEAIGDSKGDHQMQVYHAEDVAEYKRISK